MAKRKYKKRKKEKKFRVYGKSRLLARRTLASLPSYKRELVGVIVGALLVFLSLSFLSYNPTDNSWFYFSSANKVTQNWCGKVGAHVAALFFFLLGNASYVLLLCQTIFMTFLFRIKTLTRLMLRMSTLPVFVFVSAALFEAGGVVGRVISAVAHSVFGRAGSIIIFSVLIWASLLILLQISFVSFASHLASAGWRAVRVCGQVGFHVGRLVSRGAIALGGLIVVGVRKIPWRWRKKEIPVESNKLWNDLKTLQARQKAKRAAQTQSVVQTQSVEPARPVASVPQPAVEKNYVVRRACEPGPVVCGHTFKLLRNAVMTTATFMPVFEAIAQAAYDAREPDITYHLPDFSEFQEVRQEKTDRSAFEAECRERGKKLEEKLLHFGVKGKVTAIRPGPVITLFEYKPEIDSKISKIVSLEDDLAMALTALSIRIIAPIPGRNVIGFEISNQTRDDVFLSDVLADETSDTSSHHLPLAFGADITGNAVVQDLVRMPHVLVAGSTGSGKSVGLNAMLVSLLCNLTPKDLRVILIDPKRLEFAPYADIPHLLFPIVTNPRKAIPVMKWVVQEMEDRYDLMAEAGVRSIIDYHKACRTNPELTKMPFIVLIIDELADLMMVAGKDVETQIARTAQMARAAGIHMIVATQRPSVDVLTGIIKVNFPARIAFRVSSKIDSRTIIDSQGAEKLLGRGDMLFLDSGSSSPERIHGAYVSSAEIARLTSYLRNQQEVEYLDLNEALRRTVSGGAHELEDELYDQIRDFVKTTDEISISLLQRKYRIGFNRSARIIEKLELDGVIAPAQGGKMRKVIR